ncbi:MAG: endo-1,4-beta-xylanase [Lachnospiraceae bacterium]|nr:endo-1,4-beta-xylanase [Lachnospiraceae bacterium]
MKRNTLIKIGSTILAALLMASPMLTACAEGDSPEIETELTPLRDAVTAVMGEDTIVGAACTKDELSRKYIQQLIEHHFNAVTFGNELKPDALFGYSNGTVPGTHEDELNGKTITVPNMDFSRAEYMCDIIKKWNDENPDRIIRIRGHVLVWHSQTPEWFFHVDYDKNKDYVSPDEMSERLEWYIREVLTHFTGEDSKYKGMFYGWDVVNEAISDGTCSYRTDTENSSESLLKDTHGSNSSWWHVYESNRFIIDAFRFANKYAPADLDLYYNDYNDTNLSKAFGIVELINAVKAAPDTRIDGMGMQGHYSSTDMNEGKFETCAKQYLECGVKVMITEWDLKAADSYDPSSEESIVTEYTRQARRYETLYKKMQKLQEKGYDIAGFTFWGTIDKFSWLQSRSDVGGGSTSGNTQCPLLFDDDCKAKPAYWAFVDSSHITDMQKAFKEKEKAEKEAASTEEVTEEVTEVSTEEAAPVETETTVSEEQKETAPETEAVTEEPAKKRTTGGIIATCVIVALLVLGGSLLTQKLREKKDIKKHD